MYCSCLFSTATFAAALAAHRKPGPSRSRAALDHPGLHRVTVSGAEDGDGERERGRRSVERELRRCACACYDHAAELRVVLCDLFLRPRLRLSSHLALPDIAAYRSRHTPLCANKLETARFRKISEQLELGETGMIDEECDVLDRRKAEHRGERQS